MDDNFLKNVYGYSTIKEELYLIRQWYFDSDKLGDKKELLPKGILFYGKPGGGKTHLAREYSKSFDYPIFVIEGNSDNLENEIVSAYDLARKEKNAIVVIDELDSLIDKDEKLRRVLQSQLDGFNNSGNILTIATANNYYDLPEPLLREGRFDRKFKIYPIDKNDFLAIVKGFSLSSGLVLTDDEIVEVADYLRYYPVSMIRATFNNASMRYGKECTIDDILNTIDFIKTGFVNKTNNYEIRKEHAIHEAGHSIYLYFFSKTQEFLRVYFNEESGSTVYKELIDLETDEKMLDTLRCCLAGIVAEELILKKHGIGCSLDLEKAKDIAFNLINISCYQKVDYIATTHNMFHRDNISSYESKVFDVRVAKFIHQNYRYVKRCLKKHKKDIRLLADYLISHKSIKKNELNTLLGTKNEK